MPRGELSIAGTSIPQYAPPYPTGKDGFRLSAMDVEYYTTAESAKAVLPDFLEIEDEPKCRSSVVQYHMSTVGAYNEYIHAIEVTWKGKKFNYIVGLILDNESAIFAGRERWGFPKVFGDVDLKTKTSSAHMIASVERPKGQHIIQLGFTPTSRHTGLRPPGDGPLALSHRVIPSPAEGAPPDVNELCSSQMKMTGGDLWIGKGSVAFPIASEYSPFHKMPVVRYGNAFWLDNADAVLELGEVWKL